MNETALNYYLLLELDPSVDDWGVIEKRLEEKKRKWSRDATMGTPAARRKAEHYVSTFDSIVAALKNPETRKEHAREARRLLESEKQAKLKELDGLISILKAEGRYSKSQIGEIQKKIKGALTEKEIEARIQAAGILPEDATEAKKPKSTRERPPEEDRKLIRRNLDFLNLSSLYELLGESPRASYSDLRDKADESNRELLRIGKTDPQSNARKELLGICIKQFSDEDNKRKYDNALALEAMDALKNQIDMAGSDGFISIEEMDVLVNQARERNVAVEDAREYINEYAQKRKWKVQRTGVLPSSQLLLCGFCSTLAKDEKATHCHHCGEALRVACPKCNAQVPTQEMACTKCGFNTGCVPIVKGLLKEGQQLAVEGEFAKAIRCFDRALLYWPDWSELQKPKREVEEKQKKRVASLEHLRGLIRSALFVEATSAIESFEATYGNANLESIQQQAQQGIKNAKSLFEDGESKRLAGKSEEAFDRYAEALRICADFDPAKRAMAKMPPPPPQKLVVTPLANGFRLVWQPIRSRWEIRYVIIKKADGLPTNQTDGIRVGEVENAAIDDTDVDSGTPWYYAIFTSRNGVLSREAVQSGPHLAISEVKHLEVRAGDGEVTLSWKPPNGCQRVEVWRKENAIPAQRGDGVQIPTSGNGVQDTRLKNDVTYGYLVVAVFSNPTRRGEELFSTGVHHKAIPVALPKAVEDLKLTRNKENVVLTWTPVSDADVQIRQTANLPDYTSGLIIPLQQAARFGELVPLTSKNRAQVTITRQGMTFFVPIAVVAETAVVGTAVRLTTIEDVTELKSQTVGKNIILFWKWPQGIDETMVCFSHSHKVSDPLDSHATQERVTRQQYDRNGCWELRLAASQRHYFTVFAKAPNTDIYSQGAQTVVNLGKTGSARYRVVLKKSRLTRAIKDAWIELEGDGVSSLPGGLCVVGKKRNTPVSLTDGVLISEVGGINFQDGKALIPIEEAHWGTELYVKLFFKDQGMHQEVRLLPSKKEELKLA